MSHKEIINNDYYDEAIDVTEGSENLSSPERDKSSHEVGLTFYLSTF